MSYHLHQYKINIGGPDGNTWFLLAKVIPIIRQVEGEEAASAFRQLCLGQTMCKLGFTWSYEDVLKTIIDKTGITFISYYELPISPELYTLEKQFLL